MCLYAKSVLQSRYLQQHSTKLASLVAMVTQVSCHGNQTVREQGDQLGDLLQEVDNQTTLLTSLADLTVQSGKYQALMVNALPPVINPYPLS